jgi:hypothetical protein
MSDNWHILNPGAASHLFGGCYDNWDDFKDMITYVFFNGEIKVTGGVGPITEFEKVMMVCIRAHQAYEYDTIGLIFGCNRRPRIGEHVHEYDNRLGEIGLMLGILDV